MAIMRLNAKVRKENVHRVTREKVQTMAASPYETSEEVHLERTVRYGADGVKEYTYSCIRYIPHNTCAVG